jgi:hypothetical protein
MNIAAENAELLDLFIGLTKRMIRVWIALNARLL